MYFLTLIQLQAYSFAFYLDRMYIYIQVGGVLLNYRAVFQNKDGAIGCLGGNCPPKSS